LDIGAIWDLIILNPMLNGLVWLSNALFSNFGLSIIVLTFVVRGVMYPLTIKQLHATRAMQALQPRLKEIQKKYAKDKQKLAQEQMRLYKESGVSPAGCLLPMLIQMPIWSALYQSIIRVMAVTPEDFVNLSHRLYDWPVLYSVLPLSNDFLWMDLSVPNIPLAILVGASMWVQQKMVTPVTTDPAQQTQGRMMVVMMPLMFMFFSMTFPAGLALFWVASTVITIFIQYFVTGFGSLAPTFDRIVRIFSRDQAYRKRIAEVERAPVKETASAVESEKGLIATEQEEVLEDEGSEDKRQDSRRGYRTGSGKTKRKSRSSRGRRSKRR
jgi:YidC/Oxa1 family membrane protein insertase